MWYRVGVSTIDEFEGWEPADDVLRFAAAAGQDVSRAQLVRWHKHGVIPRPRTRYESGRRGLETLYPPGTSVLVVDVSELHVRRHGLKAVTWQLWWSGYERDMTEVRAYMEKVCDDYDKTLDKIRRLVRSERLVPGSRWTVRGYLRDSPDVPAPFGTIRRRLNWGGARDFDVFVNLILRAMVGDTVQPSPSECEIFERALCFDGARQTPLHGSREWWEQEDGSAVVWMGRFMSRPLVERLKEASDDDLLEARNVARKFFQYVVTFGEVMCWIFGRRGLGFGFIGKFVERFLGDPDRQAMIVLVFDSARRDPVLSKGLLELGPTMESWNTEGYKGWQQLRLLAAEVPAVAELLSPTRLRESFKNSKGQDRLSQEVAAFRTLHADEIDAVVKQHPELFPPVSDPDQTQLSEAGRAEAS